MQDYQQQAESNFSWHDFRRADFTRLAEKDTHPKRAAVVFDLTAETMLRYYTAAEKKKTADEVLGGRPGWRPAAETGGHAIGIMTIHLLSHHFPVIFSSTATQRPAAGKSGWLRGRRCPGATGPRSNRRSPLGCLPGSAAQERLHKKPEKPFGDRIALFPTA